MTGNIPSSMEEILKRLNENIDVLKKENHVLRGLVQSAVFMATSSSHHQARRNIEAQPLS